MSQVEYDGAPRPALTTTLADEEPIPAVKGGALPWDDHEHEWVELYRSIPFGEAARDDHVHDTAEPPRDEAGEPKTLMRPEEFNVEQHGDTAYTVTPAPAEVVFQCQRCMHTEPVRIPARILHRLQAELTAGKLRLAHLSILGHEELFGAELAPPAELRLKAPDPAPDWLEEQKTIIAEQMGGPA